MAIRSIPRTEIEVRDLRLMVALSRAGTTKGAAGLLHLAQPSVSRALLSLEERLGCSLFDRTPQGLVPTATGVELTARGEELLGQLCDLDRSLRQSPQQVVRIELVCGCYAAYHWLPSALVALRRELPGLERSATGVSRKHLEADADSSQTLALNPSF